MKYWLLLIWLCTLVGAYLLGANHFTESQNNADFKGRGSYEAVSDTANTNTHNVGKNALTKVVLPNADNQHSKVQDTSAKTKTTIDDVMNSLDSFAPSGALSTMLDLAKIYTALSLLDDQELLSIISAYQSKANDPKNKAQYNLLLLAYAERQPLVALDYTISTIESDLDKLRVARDIIELWSKKEPLAALDWYQKNESNLGGPFKSLPLTVIFKELSSQDMNLAIDALQEISQTRSSRRAAVEGIANQIDSGQDFQELMQSLVHFDSDSIEQDAISSFTRRDPQEASGWVDEYASELSKDAELVKDDMFRVWQYTNFEDAANWRLSTGNIELRQSRFDKIIEDGRFTDYEASLNWVEEQTNLDRTKAYESILSSALHVDPGFAIDNLYRIEDGEKRVEISRYIYKNLKKESVIRAESFLAESPDKEEILKQIEEFKKYEEKLKKYEKN